MLGSTSPPERLVAAPMLVTSALLPHPHPRAAPTSIRRLAPASLAAGEAGGGEAAVVCRGRKRRRPSSPAAVNASSRATFGNAAAPRALNPRTAGSIQRRWRQRWRRQRQRQPSPAVVASPPGPAPPPHRALLRARCRPRQEARGGRIYRTKRALSRLRAADIFVCLFFSTITTSTSCSQSPSRQIWKSLRRQSLPDVLSRGGIGSAVTLAWGSGCR